MLYSSKLVSWASKMHYSKLNVGNVLNQKGNYRVGESLLFTGDKVCYGGMFIFEHHDEILIDIASVEDVLTIL